MRQIVFALTLLVSFPILAQTGEKNFIDQNYIEVTGKSEMEIVPDLIYLKILLNEKDNKNKISVTELEKQMTAKLTEIGIDITKDLLVKDITSNFKSYFLSKNEILLSKEFQLIVHDARTAGKVFVEMEKLGISNISIGKLDHSKIIEYRKEVKINAMKAAKEKAQSLAMAIDQNIGRAIFIQEHDYLTFDKFDKKASNSFYMAANTISSAPNLSDQDIDFEKIKLEYSILCRFELK